MKRREFAAASAFFVSALFARPGFAGSYLTRAALLLGGAERDSAQAGARPTDKELARMVHRVALGRVMAAREMEVPKEVVPAHPHLLLLLEGHERSAEALVRGETTSFLVLRNRAREETVTFRAILKDAGYELPNV